MNNYCEFDNLNKNNKNKVFVKKLKHKTLLTRAEIKSNFDVKNFGKSKGIYSSIFCSELNYESTYFEHITKILIKELKFYLKKINVNITNTTKVFIVGLGNHEIPADKLGYCVCLQTISTYNLIKKNNISNKYFANTFSIAPSVECINGLSTANIIKSLTKEFKPDLVILIDSLTCKNIKYIGKTIQISSSGLTPGGEISKNNFEINKDFLKVPVITIGCPLVISTEHLTPLEKPILFLSSKDVAFQTKELSKIIAYSLNKTIHKKLTKEEILFLSNN